MGSTANRLPVINAVNKKALQWRTGMILELWITPGGELVAQRVSKKTITKDEMARA